ncbi:hypothetical protein FN846DRAFT_1007627 [Sphaerosporella brunnea]|uniref:Uncharacterized protein n=1 Tax=Sphaerosporella brunnea TaxID=1250544 RepID=A0A5J5ECF3_9PEZI|nr:hypothetical protein FN846DRAFT_1007627 [Sphaerosporella brunnea]
MADKLCAKCPNYGEQQNYSRHMRRVHHRYLCLGHDEYSMAAEYTTKNTALLKCGCQHRLLIGVSTDWWRTVFLARKSLNRLRDSEAENEPTDNEGEVDQDDIGGLPAVNEASDNEGEVDQDDIGGLRAENESSDNERKVDQGDISGLRAENEPSDNEDEVVPGDISGLPAADVNDFANFTVILADDDADAELVQDFADELAELNLAGNEAAVSNGSADVPGEANVVAKKAEDLLPRFGPRAYGSLPAMGAYGGNSTLPPRHIVLRDLLDPEDLQRQLQQQDDAVPANQGAQEIAPWDKALFGRRVASIACIRQLPEDKTIGWTPGSKEITYGANGICRFDAVCLVEEFAPRMASLLADRDADHPLVLFLRGQSGSGKTWVERKLLESLEGADISITSFEGGAAKRTIPPSDDKRRAVKLTKRLLDKLPKWSKTAKTAANENSSRAVVCYRMDSLLLIDIPGGEVVGDRPEETARINATNSEVWETRYHFRKTRKAINKCFANNHAVGEFFVKALRISGVRVLVGTVVRDTDVGKTKALGPLAGRFQGLRSKQA